VRVWIFGVRQRKFEYWVLKNEWEGGFGVGDGRLKDGDMDR